MLYANWNYARAKPVIAALIQGAVSGIIALGMR